MSRLLELFKGTGSVGEVYETIIPQAINIKHMFAN